MMRNFLKKGTIFTALLLICMTTVYSAFDHKLNCNFNQIFIFGDSLSDNGNFNKRNFELALDNPIGPILPLSPLYYQGRFTNGKVWVEKLSEKLKISKDLLFNYAYGGASVIDDFYPAANLDQQVDTFLHWDMLAHPHALYIIWMGGNDIMRNLDKSDDVLIFSIIKGIEYNTKKLIAKGARYILIPHLIDISTNPYSIKQDKTNGNNRYSTRLKNLGTKYNSEITTLLNKLKEEFKTVNFMTHDFSDLMPFTKENMTKYGFNNLSEACNLNDYAHSDLAICDNPEEYIFWDDVHPTQKVHGILAESLYYKILKDHALNSYHYE